MTKNEALKSFRAANPHEKYVRHENDGRPFIDKPMLREDWNNYTDALCKDKQISQKQYDTWTNPF